MENVKKKLAFKCQVHLGMLKKKKEKTVCRKNRNMVCIETLASET